MKPESQTARLAWDPPLTSPSLCQRLADIFRTRPNVWIDGRELMQIGGTFAFRTRISELRRGPWHMTIRNNVIRCKTSTGQTFTRTSYRYEPKE